MSLSFRSWGVEVERLGDTVLARFVSYVPLDAAGARTLRRYLSAFIQESGCCQLVVNYRLAEIADPQLLDALATFHQRLRALNGKVRLCGVRAGLYDFFAILDLPLPPGSMVAQALESVLIAISNILGHAARYGASGGQVALVLPGADYRTPASPAAVPP
jgi:anti-anti-sigma regulatory factor